MLGNWCLIQRFLLTSFLLLTCRAHSCDSRGSEQFLMAASRGSTFAWLLLVWGGLDFFLNRTSHSLRGSGDFSMRSTCTRAYTIIYQHLAKLILALHHRTSGARPTPPPHTQRVKTSRRGLGHRCLSEVLCKEDEREKKTPRGLIPISTAATVSSVEPRGCLRPRKDETPPPPPPPVSPPPPPMLTPHT